MTIPAEALDVAAVVTGGERLPLTGWQRVNAICAMHALGFRRDHIADRLGMLPFQVAECARRNGRRFNVMDEPDWTAVDFACQGTPMRLKGVDLDEVIRRLGPTRTTSEIARLTGSRTQTVTERAKALGVEVRPHVQWSYAGRPARQPQAA